jgi:hypothetical protein
MAGHARFFAGCREQSSVVLGAWAAAEQVRGDTGVPAGRLGPGFIVEDELDIDVQDA